ncbi:unnamed protein product [Ilex paraguariensis]|uniref:Uncharacterized protein n=1 Tax=Ilex paraguariensis TaxID=185542 RepID=A0ABC8RSJ3_9AQUA
MIEKTRKIVHETPTKIEEVTLVFNVSEAEKASTTTTEKEAPPHREPKPEKPASVEEVVEVEKEKEEEKITESASFKEARSLVGELPDPKKKALNELKEQVQEQVPTIPFEINISTIPQRCSTKCPEENPRFMCPMKYMITNDKAEIGQEKLTAVKKSSKFQEDE